jgi:hypothetical protein
VPRYQALSADGLSLIIWRDTMFLYRDIHRSSLLRVFFDLTPNYLRKAPCYDFYAILLMKNKESLRSVSKNLGFLRESCWTRRASIGD